ncbi:MAG: hypothetical protein GXP45_01175 [bacterium]|nr:hypothetical protein [bacterium]
MAYDSAGSHDGILDGPIGFGATGIDNKAFCLNGVDSKITTVDFPY